MAVPGAESFAAYLVIWSALTSGSQRSAKIQATAISREPASMTRPA